MRRIVEYVERQNPLLTLAVIPVSITFRGILEGSFEINRNLHFQITLFKSFLFFFLHQGAFYFAAFVWLAVLLSLFSGKRVLKSFNFVATFSPIIVLPPLIDALSGGGYRLRYIFSWKDVGEVLVGFFNPFVKLQGITYGMRLEITLAMLGLGLYAYLSRRRIADAVLTAVATFFVLMFIGSLPGVLVGLTGYRDAFRTTSLLPDDTLRYALLELFALILGLVAFLFMYRKEAAVKVLLLRWQKLPFYLAMGLVGFVLGWRLGAHLWPHPFANPFDYLAVVGLLLALTAAHHFGVLINDYFDVKIDEINRKGTPLATGILSPKEVKVIAAVLFTLSLSLFLSLNWDAFILGLALVGLAWVYSAPPLRTKRLYVLGTLTLGLIALFCQYVGASLWIMEKTLIVYPTEVVLATLVGVSLGFMVKDVEDEPGDRQFGVRTNYTLFGMEVGRWLSGLFTGGVFLLIPIILGLPKALIFAVPLALAGGFVASRRRFYEYVLWALFFLLLVPVAYMYVKKPVRAAIESVRTYNHYNYAVLTFRQDTAEGRRVVDSLLNMMPCDPRLVGLRMRYLRDTDPKEALRYYGEVRRECRVNGDILLAAAESHARVGDEGEAERLAKEAVRAGEVRAFRFLAALYRNRGMMYEAAKYERKFRRLGPKP